MIRATAFLDPRGRRDRMEFIGGPLDGDDISTVACVENRKLRELHAGEYCWADTPEWSYVWVPCAEHRSQ